MKLYAGHRLFLRLSVAILLFLGLCLVWAGREAASWRPVLFGKAAPGAWLTVSPDGRFLMADGKLFDLETGKDTTLEAQADIIQCAFSSDSQRIALVAIIDSSSQLHIAVYALPDCKRLWCTSLVSDSIYQGNPGVPVQFSSDLRFFWTRTHRLEKWNLTTGKRESSVALKPLRPMYGGWQISPDGTSFITSTWLKNGNRRTVIYRLCNGQQLQTFSPTQNDVAYFAISPDSSVVALGEDEGALLFRHMKTGAQLWVGAEGYWKANFAFSPDSKNVALIEDNLSALHIREAKTGKLVRTLIPPRIKENFSYLAWTPDNRYIFVSDHNGTIWKIRAQ